MASSPHAHDPAVRLRANTSRVEYWNNNRFVFVGRIRGEEYLLEDAFQVRFVRMKIRHGGDDSSEVVLTMSISSLPVSLRPIIRISCGLRQRPSSVEIGCPSVVGLIQTHSSQTRKPALRTGPYALYEIVRSSGHLCWV